MKVNASHFINLTKISQHKQQVKSNTLLDFVPDWGDAECQTPGCKKPKRPIHGGNGLSRYCEDCDGQGLELVGDIEETA